MTYVRRPLFNGNSFRGFTPTVATIFVMINPLPLRQVVYPVTKEKTVAAPNYLPPERKVSYSSMIQYGCVTMELPGMRNLRHQMVSALCHWSKGIFCTSTLLI
jgi:hypothetical protein